MSIEDNFLKNKNTPILDPPKPTEAEAARAQALVYDNGSHRPDLLIPPGELHGAAHLEGVLDRELPLLWPEAGVGSADQQTLRSDIVRMHFETGFDETLSATIASSALAALIAEARSTDPKADEAALVEQVARDTAASRTAMTDRYGIKDGEALLERTIRFVRSKPELATVLQHGGIGSRQDIVLAIAAHVFSNGIV